MFCIFFMVFFRIGTLVFIRVNAAFFIIVTFKSSAVFYRLCLRCLTDKAGIGLYAVCLSGGLTGYSSRIPTMSDGGNSCPFGNTASHSRVLIPSSVQVGSVVTIHSPKLWVCGELFS